MRAFWGVLIPSVLMVLGGCAAYPPGAKGDRHSFSREDFAFIAPGLKPDTRVFLQVSGGHTTTRVEVEWCGERGATECSRSAKPTADNVLARTLGPHMRLLVRSGYYRISYSFQALVRGAIPYSGQAIVRLEPGRAYDVVASRRGVSVYDRTSRYGKEYLRRWLLEPSSD